MLSDKVTRPLDAFSHSIHSRVCFKVLAVLFSQLPMLSRCAFTFHTKSEQKWNVRVPNWTLPAMFVDCLEAVDSLGKVREVNETKIQDPWTDMRHHGTNSGPACTTMDHETMPLQLVSCAKVRALELLTQKVAHETVMIVLSAFWQGDGSLGDNVRFCDYVRHFGACFSWELWENVTCRHFQRIDICDHLCTCICKFVSIFRVKYYVYGVVCACACCLQETGLHCLDNTLSLTFLSCLLSCYLQAKAKRWNAETLSNFQTLSKLKTVNIMSKDIKEHQRTSNT